MIYKKQYGHPFDTESVVGSFVPAMETIPYLTREPDGFSYAMDPQDILYGLGENIRGINKRGWVYESKCSDDPNHTESKSSLYGAYNFMIVSGKATFGFFIDYPGKVIFDCGYTDLDTLRVTVAEENYDLYIIEGESPTDIVHQFRQLVGRSYIPPKWAFGFAQSRWGYKTAEDVRAIARQYRENELPLDMICLDIDYMQGYADFTVNKERFPDLAALSAELKQQGILAGAHHRRGRAHQPGGPHLHRGAGEGIFLHQSRRHPLCGCRVARQGLFCRFSAPGSAGLVRPPLQGADRLRY